MVKWILQYGNDEMIRFIDYLHELQNIYYWLFAEPLQRSSSKQKLTSDF